MKKLLFIAIAFAGVATMTSCKKDYTCTVDGEEFSTCMSCGKTSASAFKSTCSLAGGTVTTK